MVFDLHNDYPTVLRSEEYKRYASENSDCIITAAIWTTLFPQDRELNIVNDITNTLKLLDVPPPVAIEDLSFLVNYDYRRFDFSRYFYCSLTWNYNNFLAGGAMEDGKLTVDGKNVLKAMNGGCAVDLAHLNKRSFWQVLELSDHVICSHTGFTKHRRCLDDAQIRSIIMHGGIVGLSAVTEFVGAKTVNQLSNVIDAFIQRYGCDSLCLGTDFYGTNDLPNGFNDYYDCRVLRNILSQKGYKIIDIDKIFYDNAMRFYKEINNERSI